MFIIPIAPATVDLIAELNGGVKPEVEDEETFFIYNGPDEPAAIYTVEQMDSLSGIWFTKVTVLYRQT